MNEKDQALFNTDAIFAVDRQLIDELKARALASPSRRFRLCLHLSTDETVQEMIVVHCRNNYSRPKLHRVPSSFVVLEGELIVLFFDGRGQVTRSVRVSAVGSGKPFALRIGADLWHMPVCTTPQVVFYETLAGPFRRETMNTWAPWSPDEDDQEGILAYRRHLGIAFDE